MTAVQLKTEIQKVLDQLPGEVLPDVLNFLRNLESKSAEEVNLNKFVEKILTEDEELLKRLAE